MLPFSAFVAVIVAFVSAALYVFVKVGSGEVTEAFRVVPWNSAFTVTSLAVSSKVTPGTALVVSSLIT